MKAMVIDSQSSKTTEAGGERGFVWWQTGDGPQTTVGGRYGGQLTPPPFVELRRVHAGRTTKPHLIIKIVLGTATGPRRNPQVLGQALATSSSAHFELP